MVPSLPQARHLQLARVAVTGHFPLTFDLCEAPDTLWSLLGSVYRLNRQERALPHGPASHRQYLLFNLFNSLGCQRLQLRYTAVQTQR